MTIDIVENVHKLPLTPTEIFYKVRFRLCFFLILSLFYFNQQSKTFYTW